MSKPVSPLAQNLPTGDGYEAPVLGDAVPLEQVTLFSGAINVDAGVVTFGDG